MQHCFCLLCFYAALFLVAMFLCSTLFGCYVSNLIPLFSLQHCFWLLCFKANSLVFLCSTLFGCYVSNLIPLHNQWMVCITYLLLVGNFVAFVRFSWSIFKWRIFINKTKYFGDTPALNTKRSMTKLVPCSWKNVYVMSVVYKFSFVILTLKAKRSLSMPPENIRKPKSFLMFSGGYR